MLISILTVRKWIVTFFGSGLSPIAPGTAGSLLTSILLMLVYLLIEPTFLVWQIVLLAGLTVSSLLTVALSPWAIVHFSREDPPWLVLDEVAGICTAGLFLPIYPHWGELWPIAMSFLAFRILDITKPPPARQLEHLPAGWGILLDDLAAAVYANIFCQLLLRLAFSRL